MMVAIFGTMAADGVHDGAAIPYAVTTPVFVRHHRTGLLRPVPQRGHLSIHSIDTRRRERVLLGGGAGDVQNGDGCPEDLTAMSLGLGFFDSVIFSAVLIAIPAVGWWRGKLSDLRLLGLLRHHASAWRLVRRLVRKPPSASGLGLGDGVVSALALIVFVALVAVCGNRKARRANADLPTLAPSSVAAGRR